MDLAGKQTDQGPSSVYFTFFGGRNTIDDEELDIATHIALTHQQKDHEEMDSVRSHLDDDLRTGSLRKWPLRSPECSGEDGLKIGRKNIRSRWGSKCKDCDVGTHWTCGSNNSKMAVVTA